MTTSLVLPMPPSTNALFYNRKSGGRGRTDDYRSWIKTAGWELLIQKPKPIKGRVELEYLASEETGSDLGNLEKAATDLLVTHGLIEGDSQKFVRAITLRWAPNVTGLHVTIKAAA